MKVPGYYKSLEGLLAPTDTVAKALLFLIIVVSVFLILFGDRLTRAGWLVYLLSP